MSSRFAFRIVLSFIAPRLHEGLSITKLRARRLPKLLTRTITQLLPDITADLVATHSDPDAIFSFDFGETISDCRFGTPALGYEDFEDVSSHTLEQWAGIQQRSTPLLEQLKFGGVPVYDAKWICRGFEDLLEFIAEHNILSDDEQEDVRACRFHLDRTFVLWERSGLPNTLIHGGLNETNIAQPKGPKTNFIFFDWEFLFIGNPFLDILDGTFHPLFRNQIYYLKSWVDYCDLPTLEKITAWTAPIQRL